MKQNQRRVSLPIMLATATLALLFFTSPAKVHADAIAITGGSYTMINPFRVEPVFNSFVSDLQGNTFRAFTHVNDELHLPLGSNCSFPCIAGSTFSLNGPRQIAQFSPTGLLELNGMTRTGFFDGSSSQFITDSVTIPLDAGPELTLSTFFTMSGTISFQEFDLQGAGFTGFTFVSDIFGSGIADISLYFNQRKSLYEVSQVRYNFQPQSVPEPVTLLLFGTGLAGIAGRRIRRKRSPNKSEPHSSETLQA